MHQIDVSVIIPVYNRVKTIGAAVTSVLEQTYPVREIIIVDDGSTDGTQEAVKKNSSSKIRYLFQANLGSASARNLGIRSAHGDWIALLDSDDVWKPDKLDKQVALITLDPAIEFVHTNRRLCWENGQMDSGRFEVGLSEATDKAFLFKNWVIKTSTVLFHKELLGRADYPFREDLRIGEDYELFWRLILLAEKVGYVTEPMVDILMSGDGLSRIDDRVERHKQNIVAMNSVLNWIDRHCSHCHIYRHILQKRIALELRSLVENRLRADQKKEILEDIRFITFTVGKRNMLQIILLQLSKVNVALLKHNVIDRNLV
jgi:glycosyltransferase involved in cell wall biosynthesis